MAAVHFLNVGAGDCTIIEHASGRLTMIDINNGDDLSDREIAEIAGSSGSGLLIQGKAIMNPLYGMRKIEALAATGIDVELTNPIEFMHKFYPGRSIFRYIQSHPDLDHMRGLAALVDSGIKIWNFWDCPHDKDPDFRDEADKEDWEAYKLLSSGAYGATVIKPRRGSFQRFYNQNEDGSSGGDGLWILSPSEAFHASCNEAEDTNNSSYVFSYNYAGISVILGGDAEAAAWDEMYALYKDTLFPQCNVLKASHHGRDSGYHQKSVKAMSPEYTIISAGKKPDTEVCEKYAQYCNNVWTTRWNGNIHLEIEPSGHAQIRKDRVA
jgi:beta-lactamase superfamily II metal-dependent hydrolase